MNSYDKQAADFLKKHGITFRAKLNDAKTPPWGDTGYGPGHHYRVTLAKPGARVSFDFFDSAANYQKNILTLRPYDVLSCIGCDVNTPETFEGFCEECGYDTDSRKTYALFERCDRLARRLRAFFTEGERADLSEIQ